jgi:hypothetical protein
MREQIDRLTLDGTAVRVQVRPPPPVDLPTLLIATAMRVFERHALFERVTLAAGDVEQSISRAEVERLLGPEGFGQLREWGRWRQVLARAVQAHTGGRG